MRSLYKRVIFFFRLQWAYDKGTGRDYLFNSAPSHLRSALQSTELKQALSEIPLFQLLDQDFLLVSLLFIIKLFIKKIVVFR